MAELPIQGSSAFLFSTTKAAIMQQAHRSSRSILLSRKAQAMVMLTALMACSFWLSGQALAGETMKRAVSQMSGCLPMIENVRLGILSSKASINGMTLSNPRGFVDAQAPEERMFDVPYISVNYSRLALLRREARLKDMRIHLHELTIVKNEQGEWNLEALRGFSKDDQAHPDKFALYVRNLELQVDRVIYKDYSQGALRVQIYEVANRERFEDIHGSAELFQAIIGCALSKTPLNTMVTRL